MTIDDKYNELIRFLRSKDDEIKLEGSEEELRDRYLMLGYCPDCRIGLEPHYSIDYLNVCPRCGKWYSKNRSFSR